MKDLLEKYPKSAKIVKEYYLNKLLESLNDKGLPEDFKDHVLQQGLPEEQIIKLLEANPGALIEVFDDNKIYIGIILNNSSNKMKFEYGISNGIEGIFDNGKSIKYNSRKEAEKEAIIEAFKLLEEKL